MRAMRIRLAHVLRVVRTLLLTLLALSRASAADNLSSTSLSSTSYSSAPLNGSSTSSSVKYPTTPRSASFHVTRGSTVQSPSHLVKDYYKHRDDNSSLASNKTTTTSETTTTTVETTSHNRQSMHTVSRKKTHQLCRIRQRLI